jgi:hypothetical protein
MLWVLVLSVCESPCGDFALGGLIEKVDGLLHDVISQSTAKNGVTMVATIRVSK